MQHLRVKAKPQRVYEVSKFENTKVTRFQSFIRGVGSIAVLMPGSTSIIRRSRVGSLSETSSRVAQFWNRSFPVAEE